MNSLIEANVFFFISSLGFIIVTALAIICLAYLLKILHRIENESEKIFQQTEEVISEIRKQKNKISAVVFSAKMIAKVFHHIKKYF